LTKKKVVLHSSDKVTTIVRGTVDGENVGLALPHKLWRNDAWIDGCAKNARNVVDEGTTILSALQQFLCCIHCGSIHKICNMSPKENQGDSGPGYLSLPSSPLTSVGSLKVNSGRVTEMGWGIIMHEP
jgi:hypothetical protein